jgi:hypothetical protein
MMTDFEYTNIHEVILNTVYSGGAYKFLKEKSLIKPIVVVNLCDWENSISAEFMYKNDTKLVMFSSLEEMFEKIKPAAISINHLIWTKDLPQLIDKIVQLSAHILLTIYVHDYFMLCPTVNLLNSKDRFCNLPDSAECDKCLQEYLVSENTIKFSRETVAQYKEMHDFSIMNWHSCWSILFRLAQKIIVPSASTAELFNRAYSSLFKNKVIIIPHVVENLDLIQKKEITNSSCLKLGIIGELVKHKGSVELINLIRMISQSKMDISVIVFGEVDSLEFRDTCYLTVTGLFDSSDLPGMLNKVELDAFLLLSICPETFSYTAHEMMATNLPVICFNLGAQAEFISKYEHGIVLNSLDSEVLFEHIKVMYHKYVENNNIILKNDYAHQGKVLLDNIAKLEMINRELIAQTNGLENKIAHLDATVSILNQELLSIYRSNSWRITAPLRKLILMLKLLKASL